MPKIFDLTAKISIGSKVFYSGALEAKTVGFFENLVKKGIVNTVTKKIHSKFGPRVWDVTEFLATVSDKELEKKSLTLLNSRMEEAYERKFESGGFGTWSQIKLNTTKKREYLMKQGVVGSDVKPLWFTGRLSTAVQEGFKVTDFKSFSKESVSSKGKDVDILSTVSPIDMRIAWTEPKGAWGSTPAWYGKRGDLRSFEELVAIQTFGGTPSNIPKRNIPLWKIKEEGGRFRMGGNREFLQKVWSPFLKKDFSKIFQETATRKIGKVKERAVRKLGSLTYTFASVFGITEEQNIATLKKHGVPTAKIESSIKAQKLYVENLKKGK